MYVLCLQLFNFAVVSVGKEICLFIKLLHCHVSTAQIGCTLLGPVITWKMTAFRCDPFVLICHSVYVNSLVEISWYICKPFVYFTVCVRK